MPIEFKWSRYSKYRPRVYEPVEVGDDFHVVLDGNSRRKKLVSNGRVAFEIISRGKLYDQLLLAYESEQRRKQTPKTVVQAPEVVEQIEVAEVATPTVEVAKQAELHETVDIAPSVNAATEEPFVPQSNEWFEVRIEQLSKSGRALLLSLTTGDEVFCDPKTISASPADHKLCLSPGSLGAARIELRNGRFECLEAQFEGNPSAKEEIGRVVNWSSDKLCGWVARPCGDWLFVVNTNGKEGTYGVIEIGDWVRFNVDRSKKRSGYVGTMAHKIDAPMAQEKKV